MGERIGLKRIGLINSKTFPHRIILSCKRVPYSHTHTHPMNLQEQNLVPKMCITKRLPSLSNPTLAMTTVVIQKGQSRWQLGLHGVRQCRCGWRVKRKVSLSALSQIFSYSPEFCHVPTTTCVRNTNWSPGEIQNLHYLQLYNSVIVILSLVLTERCSGQPQRKFVSCLRVSISSLLRQQLLLQQPQ